MTTPDEPDCFSRFTPDQIDRADRLHDELRDRQWEESNACPCGSGFLSDRLYDARGIYCCRYCEICEPNVRAKYRTDVLTDSNYSCDEPIEPEDY
jgi:hypothetical protein